MITRERLLYRRAKEAEAKAERYRKALGNLKFLCTHYADHQGKFFTQCAACIIEKALDEEGGK